MLAKKPFERRTFAKLGNHNLKFKRCFPQIAAVTMLTSSWLETTVPSRTAAVSHGWIGAVALCERTNKPARSPNPAPLSHSLSTSAESVLARGPSNQPLQKLQHIAPLKISNEWTSYTGKTKATFADNYHMLHPGITMSAPPNNDITSDDINTSERIHAEPLRTRDMPYQTTADGDIVTDDNNAWQTRSPPEDGKQMDQEARNPSSPNKQNHRIMGHSRKLSAHFHDATSLTDKEEHLMPKEDCRKHRRIFSGNVPSLAHRRLDSRGTSKAVRRDGQPMQHNRVDSAGLDILSAAVDATKDELEAAIGHPVASQLPTAEWEPPEPRPSIGQVSTASYESSQYPSTSSEQSHSMHPPHPRTFSTANQPFGGYYAQYAYPPNYYSHTGYQQHHRNTSYPAQAMRPDWSMYPVQEEQETRHAEWEQQTTKPNNQGSQTFVTTLAVGPGKKTLAPSTRNTATSTEDVPSQVGHHRKMSSFSSIGTLFGPNLFSPETSDKPGHHRATSSSVSFLQAIDMGLETNDEAFLRHLQASNNAGVPPSEYRPSSPALSSTPPPVTNAATAPVDSKLAQGGTSKRVRRKCTVPGCDNRVVQGGRCISHGAKRKQCKHPGCTKNVKKAGLCSAHGPARKRCDADGCEKVAVQGGRCIAHGAKKRLCSAHGCAKQAILNGMCKKHHDMESEQKVTAGCVEIKSPEAPNHRPTHTRGLSIFQEIPADSLSSILNDPSENRGGSMW